MPVNRFGKSRLESWENPEATSMQGIQNSGARNSAGLRRSAAGVTLLWKYQRWYLDKRTWIWTPYDLASGLLDVDYQTNLSYPFYCPSQLTLMIDNDNDRCSSGDDDAQMYNTSSRMRHW